MLTSGDYYTTIYKALNTFPLIVVQYISFLINVRAYSAMISSLAHMLCNPTTENKQKQVDN